MPVFGPEPENRAMQQIPAMVAGAQLESSLHGVPLSRIVRIQGLVEI